MAGRDELLKALTPPSVEDTEEQEKRLQLLCNNLAVPYFDVQAGSSNRTFMWALIGLTLAKERAEFTPPKSRKGAPKKLIGKDLMTFARFELARMGGLELSDKEMARLSKEGKISTSDPSAETLAEQASRGRTAFKKLLGVTVLAKK